MNEVFLANYFPVDDMFTSRKEIDMIIENLNINNKTVSELQELRDNVVEYYHSLIDVDFSYMSSMQSITSVIDYVKYNKGYVDF